MTDEVSNRHAGLRQQVTLHFSKGTALQTVDMLQRFTKEHVAQLEPIVHLMH